MAVGPLSPNGVPHGIPLHVYSAGREADTATFFYQYPPTVRVQLGPCEEHGPLHRDAEYGHQPGEVNF